MYHYNTQCKILALEDTMHWGYHGLSNLPAVIQQFPTVRLTVEDKDLSACINIQEYSGVEMLPVGI